MAERKDISVANVGISFTFHPGRARRMRGFTLVEMMVAGAISVTVTLALVGLTMMTVKLYRAISHQQFCLLEAQKAIELINQEIRMSTTPLRVVDDNNAPAERGNRVLFGRVGELPTQRSITLVTVDDDIMTPQDNILVFDPNTQVSGNEVVIARWLTPIDADGAFSYVSATTPLVVEMRAGDPGGEFEGVANHISGIGTRGTEINITVAPRN